MSNIEKYRQYFTKDYLMGPNSFRLLNARQRDRKFLQKGPDKIPNFILIYVRKN